MGDLIPKGSLIRAAFGIERSLEASGRRVRITTEAPVRMGGGIARAAGADVSGFLKNPVVMWAHDYNAPPVGRCSALDVRPGVGIDAAFEFAPPGASAQADTVRALWDAGFLNGASIGFIPLEYHWDKGPEGEYPVYEKWELLEFSIVPIPRDRDALRNAVELITAESAESAELSRKGPNASGADTNAGKGPGDPSQRDLRLDPKRVLEFLQALRGTYGRY